MICLKGSDNIEILDRNGKIPQEKYDTINNPNYQKM